MNIHVVHAFTKEGLGGNPAGVVLCRHILSTETMQQIAKDTGFSETAFIEIIDARTQRIRFFAPSKEVALCGHATIASYAWLFAQKLILDGPHRMHCLAGEQNIIVSTDGSISMSQNLPTFGVIVPPEGVAHALGIMTEQLHPTLPIQIASTGLFKIFVPVRSIQDLNAIVPNFDAISSVALQYNSIGMYCFTQETLHGSTAHCRNFAPVVGIMEDSATGTSAAALSTLLHHFGLFGNRKEIHLCYEQGYSIHSPAELHVRLLQNQGKIEEVWVRGFASFDA